MFTETLPSGRVRGGFRSCAGRKITRTFDYSYEAEQWAQDAEKRARACDALGLEHDDDGRPLLAPVPVGDAPVPAPVPVPAVDVRSPSSSSPSFAAFARRWLRAREGSLAHGTIKTYGFHVASFARCDLGRIAIEDLRPSDVEQWRTTARKRGVGAPTLNARLKVIRMICRFAVLDRVIAFDPTASLRFLPTQTTPDRVLDEREERRLLDACRTSQERLCVLLGLDAGLRWGEVAGISTDAIVVRDGRRYVDVRAVVEQSSGLVRSYTKDGSRRLVPLSTERLWDAWTAVVGERDRFAASLVFTVRGGKPMQSSNWRHRSWIPLRERAEIDPGTRFHDLRHTCGTRLADAGVPRHEIARFLGHADEKTTARYIHATTDGRRHDLASAALSRRDGQSTRQPAGQSGGSPDDDEIAV
jgi:integrase